MKQVIKRNKELDNFNEDKIRKAILKANSAVSKESRLQEEVIDEIVESVVFDIGDKEKVDIEEIQDAVERELTKFSYPIAKAYILRREERSRERNLENEERELESRNKDLRVYKKNGKEQNFDYLKILSSIKKANSSVETNKLTDEEETKVLLSVIRMLKGFTVVSAEDIHNFVEKALIKNNKLEVAKEYILFCESKEKNKKFNSIEEQALSLVDGTNESLRGDNANKKTDLVSSQRDYLAGLVCKSIFAKTAPKEVVKAHKSKIIHFHDSDYSPLMPMFNCDLLNIEDMLMNGFQMGDTKIDSPKTFGIAANLLQQINLIVSGLQYGGQTISWAHLIPFVQKTRDYYNRLYDKIFKKIPLGFIFKFILSPIRKGIIEILTDVNVSQGIKTYQYQIICHQSSNGQSPFVSNNLCLREAQNEQELKDFAKIIEKIFKRRIKGIKDKKGNWTGPLFPKLLYWMCDGLNLNEKDPYFYLTELAAKCNSIRCQPDINSELKSREIKSGQIIPSMGCRSWLSPIWEEKKYPLDTEFYWQEIGEDNIKYEGAPNKNFNYSKGYKKSSLVDKDFSKVVINFRGNSGWPLRIENDNIVILEPKVYGRFNSGVVTVNIPHAALSAVEEVKTTKEDLMTVFYRKLTEYFQIARKGLIFRTDRVKKIKGKNIPMHLMHGAIARLGEEDTIEDWIKQHPKGMSSSFGFIGLYETCMALIGESNRTENGQKLSIEILTYINDLIHKWAEEDNLNYSLYGTPEESLTASAAAALRRDFGFIDKITDKDYVVNSYHIDPRETIFWDEKLSIEGKYLSLCSGGAVSYIETPDLTNNYKVIVEIMKFMYYHIAYAEFNRLMGHCYTCGFSGVIPLLKTESAKFQFKCSCCGETKDENLHVDGRLCGYLGQLNAGNSNTGRLDDVYSRTLHVW